MPSFLTKVFGRKKSDRKETTRSSKRSSNASLLEGKFEAVSPTVSPSAAHFPEGADKAKDKDKDIAFALFRPKSRAQSLPAGASKLAFNAPHLTLNLPVPKEEKSHALGASFEVETTVQTLPDHVLNERRLNLLETLSLVSTCSKAIAERGGLEALGIMHPHWHSSSPDVQRKLISLYVLSLAPKSPITTLSSTSVSPISAFDSELQYTHSAHDIAAVLRWGLRHLKLESDSFGKNESSSQDEWQWYTNFQEAERTASYPSKAFSNNLVPQLPTSHLNLLITILDIISSLAAHAEVNGFSGSKLSKFLGLWLLTTRRFEDADDWNTFYSRWEKAGRIMEHIFLSWIRDENTKNQMPKRLLELVDHYPYSTPSQTSDGLLPRPRFSTRRHDALYVRVETVSSNSVETNFQQHPIKLINDALGSETSPELGDYLALWKQIQNTAAGSGTDNRTWAPVLSRVFSDDTIGLLSMIPADTDATSGSILPSPTKPDSPTRKRSMSVGPIPNGNSARKVASDGDVDHSMPDGLHKPSVTSPLSQLQLPTDWAEFSTAGFGESNISGDFASTLLDKDVEVSNPLPPRKSSKKRKLAYQVGKDLRSSLDVPSSARSNFPQGDTPSSPTIVSKSTSVAMVQIDEAFIDFWSDALLDSISSKWPKFVVGQLKRPLELDGGEKVVNWIVIEQVFSRPLSPPTPVDILHHHDKSAGTPVKRAGSPRPSLVADRMSLSLSAAVKRFNLFGSQEGMERSKDGSKKKATSGPKSLRIGEMGEILPEEPEGEQYIATVHKSKGDKESNGNTGVGVGAVALDAVNAVVLDATQKSEKGESSEVNTDSSAEPKPIASFEILTHEAGVSGEPVVDQEAFAPSNIKAGDDELVSRATSELAVGTKSSDVPATDESITSTSATPGPTIEASKSPSVIEVVKFDADLEFFKSGDDSEEIDTQELKDSTQSTQKFEAESGPSSVAIADPPPFSQSTESLDVNTEQSNEVEQTTTREPLMTEKEDEPQTAATAAPPIILDLLI